MFKNKYLMIQELQNIQSIILNCKFYIILFFILFQLLINSKNPEQRIKVIEQKLRNQLFLDLNNKTPTLISNILTSNHFNKLVTLVHEPRAKTEDLFNLNFNFHAIVHKASEKEGTPRSVKESLGKILWNEKRVCRRIPAIKRKERKLDDIPVDPRSTPDIYVQPDGRTAVEHRVLQRRATAYRGHHREPRIRRLVTRKQMDEGGWNKVAADGCKFEIRSSLFCVPFQTDLPTAAHSACLVLLGF